MNESQEKASYPARTADRSVGIIGAGIGGLTAGRMLADRGLCVRVFDKARGVGGRTSVRRAEDLHFDHGAQYFTAHDERFRRYVTEWMDAGTVEEWRGRVVVIEDGRIHPSDPQTRYVGVPGMNAVTKHLSRTLQLETQTRVASMTRRSDRWLLRDDADRELGVFDVLIVALPATQAADLLSPLPELVQRVRMCQLQPCWAVMAAFESRLELSFDGAFVHDSALSWIARNNSKPGRPRPECWVLHASPEWSAEHVKDAPETICEELLAALQQTTRLGNLRPFHTAAHRWLYALPPEPLSVGCLWDSTSRVAVCGDWCQDARVEGAFLSGLAAAERIHPAMGVAPSTE
ncbi:MAG: FAD-dependent oxidoreductase [Phycisphaerae bacterium]|nr:FAD-dependent oxidoreductase [Phycisphaerae bacterium]